jgi:hypothetical protein
MTTPKKPAESKVEILARDALLTILHANGGFTAGGEEDVRDIVRMVRVFYGECEKPTTRKAAKRAVRDEDEEDM